MKHLLCCLSLIMILNSLQAGTPTKANKAKSYPNGVTHTDRLLKGNLRQSNYIGSCPLTSTIYVDKNVRGNGGNGSLWTSAYKELSAALEVANQCSIVKTIYVAKGTYKPTYDGNKEATFAINRIFNIYGGYPPGGGIRNVRANPTILSGELGNQINSHRVMQIVIPRKDDKVSPTAPPPTPDSIFIDGLTITESAFYYESADTWTSIRDWGCGLCIGDQANPGTEARVLINQCTFSNNHDVALCNPGGQSTITNCIFTSNTDGIFNIGGSPLIVNCIFVFNSGKAVMSSNTNPIPNNLNKSRVRLINCTIALNNHGVYNEAGFYGGIEMKDKSLTPGYSNLINCVVWNNNHGISNELGKGYAIDYAKFTQASTPMAGGFDPGYSDIQGYDISYFATHPQGYLSLDPLFVDISDPDGPDDILGTADDGLRLKNISSRSFFSSISPLVNKGSNGFLPASTSFDITGAQRIRENIVDIGAYESINTYEAINSINGSSSVTITPEATSSLNKTISAYPNPMVGTNFNLRFTNQEKGTYKLVLYNSTGQVVFERRVEHGGGSALQNIKLDRTLPPGIYQLQVKGKNAQTTITLSNK